jgi:hypothetical protein
LLLIVEGEWAQFEDRAPGRQKNIVGPIGIKQDLLDRRPGCSLQALPLVDGDEDGGFDSASGHNLRTFLESGIEELAEASFCVVNLPGHGDTLYIVIPLVI